MSFSLASASGVHVTVHDAAGRRVATLLEGERRAGTHAVRWDGRDATGRQVGAGVYFVRVRSAQRDVSQKLIRLR